MPMSLRPSPMWCSRELYLLLLIVICVLVAVGGWFLLGVIDPPMQQIVV